MVARCCRLVNLVKGCDRGVKLDLAAVRLVSAGATRRSEVKVSRRGSKSDMLQETRRGLPNEQLHVYMYMTIELPNASIVITTRCNLASMIGYSRIVGVN